MYSTHTSIVFAVLTDEGQTVAQLAELTGLSTPQISSAITSLRVTGRCKVVGKKQEGSKFNNLLAREANATPPVNEDSAAIVAQTLKKMDMTVREIGSESGLWASTIRTALRYLCAWGWVVETGTKRQGKVYGKVYGLVKEMSGVDDIESAVAQKRKEMREGKCNRLTCNVKPDNEDRIEEIKEIERIFDSAVRAAIKRRLQESNHVAII